MTKRAKPRNRIHWIDIAAFAVFFCIVCLSLFSIRFQLCIEDESFHIAIAQKLFYGDHLFVEDWGATQMPHVFGILPYKLFTAITGGTDGIIVFFRYVYLFADLILFWFFYLKLRSRGWGSLITAVLLSGSPIFGQMHLSYLNMALQGILVVAFLLFLPTETNSRFRPVFIGVVFSCVVICEPGVALVYAAFTLLVFLRSRAQKNRRKSRLDAYSFVLDIKLWRGITAGIAACFIVFMTWLLLTSGLRNILDNLPGFLQDSSHMNADVLYGYAVERKWFALTETYSVVNLLLMVVSAAAALVCRIKKPKGSAGVVLFFASLLICAASYTTAIIRCAADSEILLYFQQCTFLPVHILTLSLLLLTENKDRRLTAFWIFGTAASLVTDLLSMGMICFGGKLSCVPAVFLVGTTAERILRGEFTSKKVRKSFARKHPACIRVTALVLSVLVTASGLSATAFQYVIGYFQQKDVASESQEHLEPIASGPMKGIVAYDTYRRYYQAVDRDLDKIKANCSGNVFAVYLFPYAYLYLELPTGAYSTYCPPRMEQSRHLLYWQLHPEKRPEYIYVMTRTDDPNFLDELTGINESSFLSFLDDLCDYESIQGETGQILHVTRWKI